MPDVNKYNAYKKVVANYDAAVDVMRSKVLVLGQPAVVPYYYPDENDENRRVILLFGIGSVDGEVELFSPSDSTQQTYTELEDQLYVGYGDSSTNIDELDVTTKFTHSYKIDSIGDNKHIYLVIPSYIVVNKVRIDGYMIDMETENVNINGKSYISYKSPTKYNTGKHIVTIN